MNDHHILFQDEDKATYIESLVVKATSGTSTAVSGGVETTSHTTA